MALFQRENTIDNFFGEFLGDPFRVEIWAFALFNGKKGVGVGFGALLSSSRVLGSGGSAGFDNWADFLSENKELIKILSCIEN